MYFLILVRDCFSTTALHHIQNKLANLNVSKMSLHHKSLAFSKQVAHVALFLTAWHYTSGTLGIQQMIFIISIGGGVGGGCKYMLDTMFESYFFSIYCRNNQKMLLFFLKI